MNKLYKCVLLVIFLHLSPSFVGAQSLYVEPRDALADTELRIRVADVEPGQQVVIRSAMKDARGRMWRARAGFNVNQAGEVDLRMDAPASGDYSGVDPMGLVHAMQLAGEPQPFTRFSLSLNEPVTIRFSLEIDSEERASAEVVRRLAFPDLEEEQVRANGLAGRFYKPPGDGPFPGVLVLGGSGGGFSGAIKAKLLASNGFAVLTVAYFNADGVPDTLKHIPLEYFKKGIDWLSARAGVAPGGVAVFGTSRGSEPALLVSSLYPEVRSVVAVVPSHVAWRCICDEDASAWSFDGEPIPYVNPRRDPTYQPEPNTPFRAATMYFEGLKDREAAEAARIPVEKIRGAVLLVSGTDDQLWPSHYMSEQIMDRLAANNFSYPYKHIAVEGAGHSMRSSFLPLAGTTTVRGGRVQSGGDYEGVRRSQASWGEVVSFLKESMVK